MAGIDNATRERRPRHPRPARARRRLRPSSPLRARSALVALLGVALLGALVVPGGAPAGHPRPLPARGTGFLVHLRRMVSKAPHSLAAQRVAETAAIDRTLRRTPYVRVAGRQHREVALTFDDGPGPYTPAILTLLKREHVPATFFEVGVLEQYFHASTATIVNRDYPIGDHTENHAPMSRLTAADQERQLLEQAVAIGNLGAPFPRLYRPPYGLWDAATLKVLHRLRMLMVLWTVDTGDYQLPGVKAIVQRALKGARPGAIILLHDGGGNRAETVAALPWIIRGLRRRHYNQVTVPRLLLDNPAPNHQNLAMLAGSGG